MYSTSSALKRCSMDISQLFAQNDNAKKTLLDMVKKKRICHAVLLTGPHGAGKKTFARIMAAAFLCEHDTPCFTCPSCHKALSGIHPDVSETTGYIKPNSFPVDEVRRIRREAYISPNESDYRIFVLADVDNMKSEAQNALLKIIEEPPKHAIFILTAKDTGALLPTVLSRVVTLPINPVDEKTVWEYLKQDRADKDENLAELACSLAQGSIGRAKEILENESLQKAAKTAVEVIDSAVRANRYETLRLLTAAAQSPELPSILDFMAALLENAMLAKKDRISSGINCSNKRIVKMLEAVIFAKNAMSYNTNKALLMTHLCVKMYE